MGNTEMTAEQAVKTLKVWTNCPGAFGGTYDCLDCNGDDCWSRGRVRRATDLAIQSLSATTWISVDERLPEPLTLNLVCIEDCENSVLIAQFNGEKWYRNNHEILITHWMPLPEPPMKT